ncbi:MAG: hypothetical protein A2Z47_14345 [Thermodesulfovibrio sp. RBG_19FT_COMBO_42_12]|nr:MAG: hypothetical protein A2Z47_14345 [Thermodesulfovibrio sp. RBG_19FT_COMBO_42_12]
MKGNALSSNRTYEHIEEVKKMLRDANTSDREEDILYEKDKRGDELPEVLRTRNSMLSYKYS